MGGRIYPSALIDYPEYRRVVACPTLGHGSHNCGRTHQGLMCICHAEIEWGRDSRVEDWVQASWRRRHG